MMFSKENVISNETTSSNHHKNGEKQELEFCTMCLKGKLRIFSINFQEKIKMCEDIKCLYPFGTNDFEITGKENGKIIDNNVNNFDESMLDDLLEDLTEYQTELNPNITELQQESKIQNLQVQIQNNSYQSDYVSPIQDPFKFNLQNNINLFKETVDFFN